MRLSETVSRELGSRYAKVVRTCLYKWFDTDEKDTLGLAQLEIMVYENITRELERCLSAVTDELGMSGSSGLTC